MELTTEEKVENLKLVKNHVKDFTFTVICPKLLELTKGEQPKSGLYSQVFDYYPELEKYKPSNAKKGAHWYSLDKFGQLMRIELINYMLIWEYNQPIDYQIQIDILEDAYIEIKLNSEYCICPTLIDKLKALDLMPTNDYKFYYFSDLGNFRPYGGEKHYECWWPQNEYGQHKRLDTLEEMIDYRKEKLNK